MIKTEKVEGSVQRKRGVSVVRGWRWFGEAGFGSFGSSSFVAQEEESRRIEKSIQSVWRQGKVEVILTATVEPFLPTPPVTNI